MARTSRQPALRMSSSITRRNRSNFSWRRYFGVFVRSVVIRDEANLAGFRLTGGATRTERHGNILPLKCFIWGIQKLIAGRSAILRRCKRCLEQNAHGSSPNPAAAGWSMPKIDISSRNSSKASARALPTKPHTPVMKTFIRQLSGPADPSNWRRSLQRCHPATSSGATAGNVPAFYGDRCSSRCDRRYDSHLGNAISLCGP